MMMTTSVPRQDKIKNDIQGQRRQQDQGIYQYLPGRQLQGEPPSPQEAAVTAQDVL